MGRYFDKNIWHETAEECGISLQELAEKTFEVDAPLPWDFINIGVDKEWFEEEYRKALAITSLASAGRGIEGEGATPHIVPTCEKGCVNCGVCKNLKTHKVLAKPFKASEKAQNLNFEPVDPHTHETDKREVFRYRIKLTKTGILRYFSHLDWQNTFFKALSKN